MEPNKEKEKESVYLQQKGMETQNKETQDKQDPVIIQSQSGEPGQPDQWRPRSFVEELKLLLPNRNYWVMQLIIYINIGIWILMVATGTDPMEPAILDIVDWGGNYGLLTIGFQEYWRLLTSCFIHIGIVHLLFNMYALLYIGSLLEHVIGHKRFLFAYIVTGLVSSLISMWWNDDIVSAGASGAIFGMYGVYLTLLLSKKLLDRTQQKMMLTSMLIFIGYNLVYGLRDNVDNAGHIGGLIGGLVIGACFLPALLQPGKRLFARISESVIPLLLLISLFFMVQADLDDLRTDENDLLAGDMMEILGYMDRSAQVVSDISEDMPVEILIEKMQMFWLLMDSCHMIVEDCRELYELDEEQTRLMDYFDIFTELKKQYAQAQMEYILSGYSEEYQEIFADLDYQLQKLNEDFQTQQYE